MSGSERDATRAEKAAGDDVAAAREETGAARAWSALVLAASRGADDPMARHTGRTHKALVAVGGVPMLRRVVAALVAGGIGGPVAVVIDDAEAARQALGATLARRVRILGPAESAAGSVLKAVREEGMPLPMLVTTGDLPFLSAGGVRAFLRQAGALPADLVVALARREDVLAAYPEMRRTWMRLGGEAVTSCNLFALKTPAALAAVDFWRQAERNRKRPWRIALAFGPLALVRMLFSRAGARAVIAAAGRRLGLVADAVFVKDARLAIDVDKPADHALAESVAAEERHETAGR
jgi:GTP:adenosylcobinamide-phosphate guanylyltransferase